MDPHRLPDISNHREVPLMIRSSACGWGVAPPLRQAGAGLPGLSVRGGQALDVGPLAGSEPGR